MVCVAAFFHVKDEARWIPLSDNSLIICGLNDEALFRCATMFYGCVTGVKAKAKLFRKSVGLRKFYAKMLGN